MDRFFTYGSIGAGSTNGQLFTGNVCANIVTLCLAICKVPFDASFSSSTTLVRRGFIGVRAVVVLGLWFNISCLLFTYFLTFFLPISSWIYTSTHPG